MKYFIGLFVVVSSLFVFSCNSETDDSECRTNISNDFDVSIENFNVKFDQEIDKLKGVKTRSVDLENEKYDQELDSIGKIIVTDLLPTASRIMDCIGLGETDFEEIEREYDLPVEFMKVYFAMGIMEECHSFRTRANAEEIASCIVLGTGYKELVAGGAKLALKKCAQQLTKKAIPLLGWGWWAAESAACLARL